MGRVAEVIAFERVTDENGAHVGEVKTDPGGESLTVVEHFADCGDDSPPLPGDFVALDDSVGTGGEKSGGYLDVRNPGKAAPGEKRIYGRNPSGATVAEIWIKGSGAIVIESVAGSFRVTFGEDGKLEITGNEVTINGVVIDSSGNLKAPGEVSANNASAPVKLSTHMHPTAMGPSSAPTPGT